MLTKKFLTRTAAMLAIVTWIPTTAAFAQNDADLTGLGLIVDKDVAERTITIAGGVVFHVSAATRLMNAQGAPIGFSQVQVAPSQDGLIAHEPAASARYEASRQGGRLVLRELEVGVGLPN